MSQAVARTAKASAAKSEVSDQNGGARQILNATAWLLRHRGYEATTMADIGAAVGIRGPSLYKHVRSKQELLASVIEFGRSHPVLQKVLVDEPELIGPFIVAELPQMIDLVALAATPLLQAAMDAGELAPRDASRLAQMLVRLCMPLLLAPPPGDVAALLGELLLPVLTPTP